MSSDKKKVVIIGGGIAGISATYYLQKQIKEQDLPIDCQLIEASDRLGGVIQTFKKDGFIIERGPDSLLSRKPSVFRLIEEVGMKEEVVPNGAGQSFILVDNKLHKMPSGAFMGVPTEITPFLFSNLFSSKGKMRASADFFMPKSKPQDDQSLGEFFRRRLGDEVVENLIEPLLSGIYSGDIDKLSLMATFPNFYYLEQKYGSLVKGLKHSMPKKKKSKGPKPSVFRSLKSGMETLVHGVESKLEDGSVKKGCSVDHIEKKDEGYHLLLSNGEVVKADSVVIAAPHKAAYRMLTQFDFMEPLKEQPATSVANIAMAFDQSAIEKDIDGSGYVVSRNSDFRITACTWMHKKWPHSSPNGKALLRAYVGKPGDEDIVSLSDEEITEIVLKDLNKTMNITQKPDFTVLTRWKDSRAQYTVGHKQRLATIREKMETHLPGVFLAGASYEGLGVPDCIDQGEKAVENVLNYMNLGNAES